MTTGLRPVARRWRDDGGATLVEFALGAMVFFITIFGVMDFGRMIFYYNMVSNSSSEGARFAAVRGSSSGHVASTSDIQTLVVNRTNGLLTTSNVTVQYCTAAGVCGTWASGTKAAGGTVRVTTTYVFTPIVPVLPQAARTLTSNARMVVFR